MSSSRRPALLYLNVDRHDGIDAEEQVGPGIEGHAGVHRATSHPVNVLPSINLDRCVKAGQSS